MKKNILVSLTIVLVANFAVATEVGKYLLSGSFRLEKAKPYKAGIESASWSGSVVIRGRLYLDIDRSPATPDVTGDAESFLSFVPEKSSVNLLPKVSGNVYPASPLIINFGSGSMSKLKLEKILSESEVERIHKEEYGHYEWPATVLMRRIATDIGCDSRSFYSVDYRVTVNNVQEKHSDRPKHLGC